MNSPAPPLTADHSAALNSQEPGSARKLVVRNCGTRTPGANSQQNGVTVGRVPTLPPCVFSVSAVFFPAEPESRVDDLVEQARQAQRPGLRLYTNGRQFALLPKPRSGWALFAVRFAEGSPCAA
jgi:hypothetical protein